MLPPVGEEEKEVAGGKVREQKASSLSWSRTETPPAWHSVLLFVVILVQVRVRFLLSGAKQLVKKYLTGLKDVETTLWGVCWW